LAKLAFQMEDGPMKTLCIFAYVLLSSINFANAGAYKCDVNGKLVFQDHPCLGGTGEALKLDPVPLADPFESLAGAGKVIPGMTEKQVKRAWGEPTSINPSFTAGHSFAQWVYRRDISRSQYIYFQDGIVTGWN
jgi:hypothetical protein